MKRILEKDLKEGKLYIYSKDPLTVKYEFRGRDRYGNIKLYLFSKNVEFLSMGNPNDEWLDVGFKFGRK